MNNKLVVQKFVRGDAEMGTSLFSVHKGMAENREMVLYSHGYDYPLAIRRDWGAGVEYLVNSDPVTVTTNQHQGTLLGMSDTVVIPFRLLKSVGLAVEAAQGDGSSMPTMDLRVKEHERNGKREWVTVFCVENHPRLEHVEWRWDGHTLAGPNVQVEQ